MKTKSLNLAKKATLGAAATGAVFALQHSAEAAVIYSGVQNFTATIGPGLGTQSQFLNIDNLSGNDFVISVRRTSTSGSFFGRAVIGGYYPNGILRNAGNNPKLLASGAAISSGALFNGGGVLRSFANGVAGGGTWASGQTGFAGLQFLTGANTYYGWVRLQWTDSADGNPDPNTITAIDWAYNNSPDAPILAGDTGAVPEPSRALLALAGLGAMALRRRRKVA